MSELLGALKGLLAEVKLGKLNIRKDFSLINAHAYANKVIHNIESQQSLAAYCEHCPGRGGYCSVCGGGPIIQAAGVQ